MIKLRWYATCVYHTLCACFMVKHTLHQNMPRIVFYLFFFLFHFYLFANYFTLFISIYLFRCSSTSSSSSEEEDYTIHSTKCPFMENGGYTIDSKIINVLAVLSFLCLMNSFVLAKSSESKNTNLIYISISICLISTAIGSILLGNVWEKYCGLSTICYFGCELALALYVCLIIFFLKSLFCKEIQFLENFCSVDS